MLTGQGPNEFRRQLFPLRIQPLHPGLVGLVPNAYQLPAARIEDQVAGIAADPAHRDTDIHIRVLEHQFFRFAGFDIESVNRILVTANIGNDIERVVVVKVQW